jgi:hypothetical protein
MTFVSRISAEGVAARRCKAGAESAAEAAEVAASHERRVSVRGMGKSSQGGGYPSADYPRAFAECNYQSSCELE